MENYSYIIGVFLAISAGIFAQLGAVFQKKAINGLPPNSPKFMRNLFKAPLWVVGLLMGYILGTICILSAQLFIGPALMPGLTSSGLIILAIGSIKIIGEKLKGKELLGIALMIGAITLIGFSNLQISITKTSLLEASFLFRLASYTGILAFLSVICYVIQKRYDPFRGIILATLSGIMYSLSNLWISPMLGTINNVIFEGLFNLGELILFIASSIILVLVNIIGVSTIQMAFKYGQASNLVPFQMIPNQIAPIFVFFYVFNLVPSSPFSILFLLFGIAFITISSFLLARRQEKLDKIK